MTIIRVFLKSQDLEFVSEYLIDLNSFLKIGASNISEVLEFVRQ